MNLAIFFDPVSESVVTANPPAGTWQSNIRIFHESFPSLEHVDIAIVGVPENRGTDMNVAVAEGPDAAREVLYTLKKGNGLYRIADLGNLRSGETYEDTLSRLKEVCQGLMELNIVPVIVGGSHDLDVGQYMAFESLDRAISLVAVDARVDMEHEGGISASRLERILTHKPNFLFHYSHLGFQSFLVEQEKVDALEKLYFEVYRLGQVKDDLAECEPVIRNADMLSFDLCAIKMSDAPGNVHAIPFGLTAEEACQLCWYAGVSSKMASLGIYEFNPRLDDRGRTAFVVSTMIWYFVEGFYHRKAEVDISDLRFMKYIVDLKEHPHKLCFYKDTMTDKWWMEVTYGEAVGGKEASALIPCSYKDYSDAVKGDIPNRWILTQAKLS